MVNILQNMSGGMSQDDFFVGKWQSIYSHWIDIVNSPSELKLMPFLDYDTSHDTSLEVTSIFSPENWRVYYGQSDGWIMEYNVWGRIQISNPWFTISDGCLFLGNFYIFTTRYVYKTTYTNGALSAISTWYDPGSAEWYHHPAIYQGGEMYFPSGKNVKYTNSTGTLQTLFSTNFSNNVRWVTISGSNLRVYTDNLIAIVDIGSKTVSYSQVLPFIVTWVKSDGNVDYVTTQSNELYICSGLEWRKIAGRVESPQLSAYIDPNKFTFKSSQDYSSISTANGVVYTLDQEMPRILIYGRKMEWLPNAFSYWPITHGATGNYIEDFSAVFSTNNELYVAYRESGLYRFAVMTMVGSSGFCTEWIYITPPTDFGDYSMLKAIDEIRVGKTGTWGELWCSINEWDYEKIGDLDQTELEQKFMEFKRDFRQISFLIKLTSSSDVIKNIDLRFTNRIV